MIGIAALFAVSAALWVRFWNRRVSAAAARRAAEEERQRAPVEDARRRYKAALTAFASARSGEGTEVEQRRRDDAFAVGRAYYELFAATNYPYGVPVPYESAGPWDIHLHPFAYGPHMHTYRDSFIEADLERVAAGLVPEMSWLLAKPNEASRVFLAELARHPPPRSRVTSRGRRRP
jgi:hypothetical protein